MFGPTPLPPADPAAAAPSPADPAGEATYHPPPGTASPMTGKGTAPRVKRFSRKMVFAMAAIASVVASAAFVTALSRGPAISTAAGAAQAAPAASTPTDAIAALPKGYGDVKPAQPPQLGPPLSGDLGAIQITDPRMRPPSAPAGPGQPAAPAAPRQLTPAEQYEQQEAVARLRRLDQARQGGFSFPGNSAGAAPGAGAPDPVADLARALRPPAGAAGTTLVAAPAPNAARDDDNRQDDKGAFVNGPRRNRFQLEGTAAKPRSPYTIFGGTFLPGVLITGINSDLPGQIKGQVSQNVYDTVSGKYLLIPQGTNLVGQYDSRVTYGQSRVLIVWTRLIRPDGLNLDLEGMAGVDLSGHAGLTGDVDRHVWRLLSAVVLGSVIQAGVQAGGTVASYGAQDFMDAARQGIGQGVTSATNQLVRKELQIQPTIRVAPGERFNVFTTRDIEIPPYEG